MKEFDYKLDYKKLDFTNRETRKKYRIGRGEQGVLLVRPYTDDICKYWKFKTPEIAFESASRILFLYHQYKEKKDFVGMDMCRKFLEMGFTRSRRYANHKDGRIYDEKFNRLPQEPDALTSAKAVSARVFRNARNVVTKDPIYVTMRKQWRSSEQ